MSKDTRSIIRGRKKLRYRHKLLGVSDYPRLSVFKSHRHISVQAVDDVSNKILCYASTREKEISTKLSGKTGGIAAAKEVAIVFAERLKSKNIAIAKFDRNGFLYHGAVASLAQTIRDNGIKI